MPAMCLYTSIQKQSHNNRKWHSIHRTFISTYHIFIMPIRVKQTIMTMIVTIKIIDTGSSVNIYRNWGTLTYTSVTTVGEMWIYCICYMFWGEFVAFGPFFQRQSVSGCGNVLLAAVRQYAQMCLYLMLAWVWSLQRYMLWTGMKDMACYPLYQPAWYHFLCVGHQMGQGH